MNFKYAIKESTHYLTKAFYVKFFLSYYIYCLHITLWRHILVTGEVDEFAASQRISNIEFPASNICLKKYEVKY